jgi:hypothetical protein
MASMVGDPAFRRPYEAARAPFLRRMLGDLDGAATARTVAALLALLDRDGRPEAWPCGCLEPPAG